MKTLKAIGMVPLVLIAATAFSQGDDRAVPRSGGSSSGQSDAGSRHSGGSSGASSSGGSSNSGSQGGSSASAGSGGYSSSQSDASSRRRPRPGTGTGTRDRYGNDGNTYRSYPYSGYYYDPYSYGWGYQGRYGYGLGYGYGYGAYGYGYGDYYGYYPSPYYGSYRYRAGNIAQIRTLIEPNKSRIYVDGYYAGIADDFDGLLQRLNVSPGRHDITLKLEGYTSHTFQVYAGRDQTLKLRWDMVRGSGETRDVTLDDSGRRSDRDAEFESDRDRDRDLDRGERDRETARDRRDSDREVDSERVAQPSIQMPQAGRGEILFDILPLDASVYIDGEFHGKASQVTRVPLPFGRHRIEVVRPGYRTEETDVDVDAEGRRVVVKLDRR